MAKKFMKVEEAIEIVLGMSREYIDMLNISPDDEEVELLERQKTAIDTIEDFFTNVVFK